MKFLDGIKIGTALYVGWEIARGIDTGLNNLLGPKLDKLNDKLLNKLEELANRE